MFIYFGRMCTKAHRHFYSKPIHTKANILNDIYLRGLVNCTNDVLVCSAYIEIYEVEYKFWPTLTEPFIHIYIVLYPLWRYEKCCAQHISHEWVCVCVLSAQLYWIWCQMHRIYASWHDCSLCVIGALVINPLCVMNCAKDFRCKRQLFIGTISASSRKEVESGWYRWVQVHILIYRVAKHL